MEKKEKQSGKKIGHFLFNSVELSFFVELLTTFKKVI